MKENLFIYHWISKNISKLFVQVKDIQLIFNKKYISKKSLTNNLILLNVLQYYAWCIFAAQLEDILFLKTAEKTLYWLNSQQKIMVRVQPDIITTPVPTKPTMFSKTTSQKAQLPCQNVAFYQQHKVPIEQDVLSVILWT